MNKDIVYQIYSENLYFIYTLKEIKKKMNFTAYCIVVGTILATVKTAEIVALKIACDRNIKLKELQIKELELRQKLELENKSEEE